MARRYPAAESDASSPEDISTSVSSTLSVTSSSRHDGSRPWRLTVAASSSRRFRCRNWMPERFTRTGGGMEADAERGRHDLLVAVDVVGTPQLGHDLARHPRGILRLVDLRQQHQELVAAVAADGVGGAHQVDQARGDLLEQLVAGG